MKGADTCACVPAFSRPDSSISPYREPKLVPSSYPSPKIIFHSIWIRNFNLNWLQDISAYSLSVETWAVCFDPVKKCVFILCRRLTKQQDNQSIKIFFHSHWNVLWNSLSDFCNSSLFHFVEIFLITNENNPSDFTFEKARRKMTKTEEGK